MYISCTDQQTRDDSCTDVTDTESFGLGYAEGEDTQEYFTDDTQGMRMDSREHTHSTACVCRARLADDDEEEWRSEKEQIIRLKRRVAKRDARLATLRNLLALSRRVEVTRFP